MAWNPHPKVADCREIARRWGSKHLIIILAMDCDANTLEMATYGDTKKRCNEARRLGDEAYDAILDAFEDQVLPSAALIPLDTRERPTE
jgi:hypothetical protein